MNWKRFAKITRRLLRGTHNQQIPSVISKYYRATDYTFKSFENNELWLSTPPSLNDPFDLNLTVRPSHPAEVTLRHLETIRSTPVEIPKYNKTVVNEDGIDKEVYVDSTTETTFGQLGEEVIAAMLSNPFLYTLPTMMCGVTCFSLHSASPAMWAHYADNGKGFSVTYKPLGKSIDTNLYRIKDLIFGAVRYERQYPDIKTVDFFDYKSDVYAYRYLTKGWPWRHELEWRLISQFGNKVIECPFETLAVYLGHKMTLEHRRQLYTACQRRKVPCYQSIPHPTMFQFVAIGPIDEDCLSDDYAMDAFLATQPPYWLARMKQSIPKSKWISFNRKGQTCEN